MVWVSSRRSVRRRATRGVDGIVVPRVIVVKGWHVLQTELLIHCLDDLPGIIPGRSGELIACTAKKAAHSLFIVYNGIALPGNKWHISFKPIDKIQVTDSGSKIPWNRWFVQINGV